MLYPTNKEGNYSPKWWVRGGRGGVVKKWIFLSEIDLPISPSLIPSKSKKIGLDNDYAK